MAYDRRFIVLDNKEKNYSGRAIIERRNTEGKITLNIQGLERNSNYKTVLLTEDKDKIVLDSFLSDKFNSYRKRIEFNTEDIKGNDFKNFSHILILKGDNTPVLVGNIKDIPFTTMEKSVLKDEKTDNSKEVSDIKEDIKKEPTEEIRENREIKKDTETQQEEEIQNSRFDKYFNDNPPMLPFKNQRKPIVWVRIGIEDLNDLGIETTPFIKENFELYKHLMIGKWQDNRGDNFVFALPARYSPDYKLEANFQGYSQFKCIEDKEPEKDLYGYWLKFGI